jgi:hypothetical protein
MHVLVCVCVYDRAIDRKPLNHIYDYKTFSLPLQKMPSYSSAFLSYATVYTNRASLLCGTVAVERVLHFNLTKRTVCLKSPVQPAHSR